MTCIVNNGSLYYIISIWSDSTTRFPISNFWFAVEMHAVCTCGCFLSEPWGLLSCPPYCLEIRAIWLVDSCHVMGILPCHWSLLVTWPWSPCPSPWLWSLDSFYSLSLVQIWSCFRSQKIANRAVVITWHGYERVCHVTWCHVTLCHVTWYHVTLCHVILNVVF